MPQWAVTQTGTLNDANTTDELTTIRAGAVCFIGISLENMANGDDFDIKLDRWNGSAWLEYKTYNVTMAAGLISIDEGGGAIGQYIEELNLENVYLDSVQKLQLTLTRNSGTDRDFAYWYNKWE